MLFMRAALKYRLIKCFRFTVHLWKYSIIKWRHRIFPCRKEIIKISISCPNVSHLNGGNSTFRVFLLTCENIAEEVPASEFQHCKRRAHLLSLVGKSQSYIQQEKAQQVTQVHWDEWPGATYRQNPLNVHLCHSETQPSLDLFSNRNYPRSHCNFSRTKRKKKAGYNPNC